MWKVQLSEINFDNRELIAVNNVINSRWLSMGETVSSFESSFAEFLGGNVEAIAVSSCTAALHIALLALDIGNDDEVIIPGLTFVADANSVIVTGAKPCPADCTSLDDWNVSAATIEKVITPSTKAVIVVHFAGYPCDMPSIKELCRSKNLWLIEDVAHAPGASINNKSCGVWGDISCFSFFSNKNLCVGEGGMIASSNKDLLKRLKSLRSHGMSSLTLDRHRGRAITYDVVEPGLNYRLDEMRAAIGIVQLDKLPAGNLRRKSLTDRYRCNLDGSDISIPFSIMPKNTVSSYHILPVLLPVGVERKAVILGLKAKGIQSSIHYPPLGNFTAFEGKFDSCDTPVATEVCDRELTLPLYPTMEESDVDLVTTSLLECLA